MKKKILCLAMAVVMVVGASMTTYAKDHQGKDGWLVDFDGKELKSNFGSSDFADEAANIQPGDSIELKVQVKNSVSTKTDWYLSNEVIKTLEDANEAASGGVYEYRLSYVSSSGTQTNVLYDSATIGGEGAEEDGLRQATDSLKDYFYLGRLNKDQTGTVHLWVKVEGETQGNGYQQTLAELQLNFAVEEVPEAETITETITKNVTENKVIRQVAKTGDTSKVLLFCGLALASGIVLLILGIVSMKKNQRRRDRKGE